VPEVPEVPDVPDVVAAFEMTAFVELLLPPQAVTSIINAARVYSAGARFILILGKSRSSESRPLA
jgi:hypothetical protein